MAAKLRIMFKNGKEVVVDVKEDWSIKRSNGKVTGYLLPAPDEWAERLLVMDFDEIVCITEVK